MLQLVLIQFAALFHLPAFKLPTFHQIFAEDSAQDTLEYLLVIGVLVVGILGLVTAFPSIATTVADSVTTAVTGLL